MVSPATPPPSLRQGVRIVPPESHVTVEEVLLAVGEQVGHEHVMFSSRMNKAVVAFLREEAHVFRLIESGVLIRDLSVQVSPLAVPSTRITVSGVPPFIPNELIETELRRFGKIASGLKTLSLGCKDPKLRHVQSLRRQVFMHLDAPTQTLEVSFRVKHGDGFYMVDASSGQLKCFECGDVGHKRFECPHKRQGAPGDAEADSGGEDRRQPGRRQAAVAAESPGTSQALPAAAAAGPQVAEGVEEAASTCSAEGDSMMTEEGLSSQVVSEEEDTGEFSESDTASNTDTSLRNTDIYDIKDINIFVDTTKNFKKMLAWEIILRTRKSSSGRLKY